MAYLIVLIAVFLQIQLTVFAGEDYLGIRVNSFDIFLPFVGAAILISLIFKRTYWPNFENKKIYLSLFFIVLAMTISLFNGYYALGYWSSWAYLNKYSGIFILLSYFALGAWICTNTNQKHERFYLFGIISSMFFLSIIAVSCLGIILLKVFEFSLWIETFPWDGFMANRNSFMVLAIFCMLFLEIYRIKAPNGLILFLANAFWLIAPIFALYNASRSGWIIGTLFLIYILISYPKHFLKHVLPCLLMGFAIMTLAFHYIAVGDASDADELRLLKEVVVHSSSTEPLDNYGDQKRYIAVEDGLQMYSESDNYLFGAGLGVYKEFQIEKRGEFIDVMDFSALWLLSETGIFGLTAFALFFLIALKGLYIEGFRNGSAFHQAIFIFLLVMITISVLHELLYTRLLWFVLGLSLAIPKADQKMA